MKVGVFLLKGTIMKKLILLIFATCISSCTQDNLEQLTSPPQINPITIANEIPSINSSQVNMIISQKTLGYVFTICVNGVQYIVVEPSLFQTAGIAITPSLGLDGKPFWCK